MTLIAENGVDRVRVVDIGRQAGMSPGHVLYYFGTKERILLETLRWSEAELGQRREALLRKSRAGWQKLRRFAELYLPDSPADPRWILWIATWDRARSGALAESLAELEEVWRADFVQLISEGMKRGAFAPVDADDFSIRSIALLDGLGVQVLEGVRSPSDAADIAERAARVELAPKGGR